MSEQAWVDWVYAPCEHGHTQVHFIAGGRGGASRCEGRRDNPLGTVDEIERWKAKAAAYDEATLMNWCFAHGRKASDNGWPCDPHSHYSCAPVKVRIVREVEA